LSRSPRPSLSRWLIIGGNSEIMLTSVTINEILAVDDCGIEQRGRGPHDRRGRSSSFNGWASSIAFGVGGMDSPTRTNNGSPKWVRSLVRILLTVG